jgi:hypothetical protein
MSTAGEVLNQELATLRTDTALLEAKINEINSDLAAIFPRLEELETHERPDLTVRVLRSGALRRV